MFFAFGSNKEGQLGLGEILEQKEPVLITHLSHIKQISCGRYHSLALAEDGNVFVFGSNVYGELGIELGEEKKLLVPNMNPNLSNIKMIACGGYHSLALTEDGIIFVFGSNEYGQLGIEKKRPIKSLQKELILLE